LAKVFRFVLYTARIHGLTSSGASCDEIDYFLERCSVGRNGFRISISSSSQELVVMIPGNYLVSYSLQCGLDNGPVPVPEDPTSLGIESSLSISTFTKAAQ
jgi:hypothetical protein